MGRYYSNQMGDEGKFWFAVQPSDDPRTVYGMDIIEPDTTEDDEDDTWGEYVDYWADDSTFIRQKLRQQFRLLGVPPEEQKFDMPMNEIGKYVWEELKGYFLTNEKPKDSRIIPYSGGEYPINKEKELAASRVQLGLFIYNSIKEYGECTLNAEY